MRALLFLLAACSSHLDRSVFETNVCVANDYAPLAGVVFSSDVYVEIDANTSPQSSTNPPMRSLLASSGTPCTRAPDKAACMTAIANAQPSASTWLTNRCSGSGCTDATRFFVTESAGTIRVVDTMDEFRALVAPVDNPHDAMLVALFAQDLDGMDCSKPQVRALPDGSFDVFLGHGDGRCTDRVEKIVHVNADATTVVKMALENKASSNCISP